MRQIARMLVVMLVLGAVIQIGSVLAQTALTGTSPAADDAVDTRISQEVLDKLKAADPANYDRNVSRYQSLLVNLNVHPKFKTEIERLVLAGHALPDVLIACEFLYQSFGKMQDLESLTVQKESGQTWTEVFAAYNRKHKPFAPRSFDPDELERMMSTPGITPDDIMLADRLSFVSGASVQDIFADKVESKRSWKQIAADLNVLHGASALPRVEITQAQLVKFAAGDFTEERVTEAFVLAQKLGETPDAVVALMKEGKSEEAIMAASYTEKYNENP